MELQIFMQVFLYEIVKVKNDLNNSEYSKYFNKIKSKCIDYVLTDSSCFIYTHLKNYVYFVKIK